MLHPPAPPNWDLEEFATGGLTQKVLDAAVQAARRYCGWHVAPDYVQSLTLDGPGGHVLQLPSLHVTEVMSVHELGVPVDDFEWSADGMIQRRSCWSDRFRSIVVVFQHGFDGAEDFASAVLSSAMTAGMSPGGVAEKVGPFSFEAGSGQAFTSDQRGVLDRYRLPKVP